MTKTIEELIECAKKEAAFRQRRYPLAVRQGRANADDVRHEIQCMEEIVSVLETVKANPPGQMTLI